MIPTEEELKEERKRLFRKVIKTNKSKGILEVQIEIANSILKVEKLLKSGKSDSLVFHIERLRLYVDSMVSRVIHSHAIRNLAKGNAKPKTLIDQIDFEEVIQLARKYMESTNLPVFVCDISNVQLSS